MSAWSKIALGWITPTLVARDADVGRVTLAPVTNGGEVLEIPTGDGSSSYLLAENRQPIGFNDNLESGGLLVWRVDPDKVAGTWAFNTVNSQPSRMGVELLQADGLDDLGRSGGGRGDSGDPFPGVTSNGVLHAGSNPSSRSLEGKAMGITITNIAQTVQSVSFDLWTRYQTLYLEPTGAVGPVGLVAVDGALGPAGTWDIRSAPFQVHSISAAPGAALAPGERVPFLGWSDGAPRERTFVTGFSDTTLVASYGGHEMQVAVTQVSPQTATDPAEIVFTPGSDDGWVEVGATVLVEALPKTGFAFERWGGDLTGEPNPTTVTVTAPMAAEARFAVTFAAAVSAELQAQAARPSEIPLDAINANLPLAWTLESGTLPAGMVLDARGAIRGTAMALGSFPLELRVADAIGLEETVSVTLEVTAPPLTVETLAGPFLGTSLGPNQIERTFLDRNGNQNGRYDLGDLRAFLIATGGVSGEALSNPSLSALLRAPPSNEGGRP